MSCNFSNEEERDREREQDNKKFYRLNQNSENDLFPLQS